MLIVDACGALIKLFAARLSKMYLKYNQIFSLLCCSCRITDVLSIFSNLYSLTSEFKTLKIWICGTD